MSSGVPVRDTHIYNQPPSSVVVYDDVGDEMSEESYEDIGVHAAGLEDVAVGTVVNDVPVRICRSLNELQNDPKLRRVYLTEEQVKQLKLPNTAFDKNGVKLEERIGDPRATVFKKVEIRSMKNGHAIPFVAEICGLQNRVPTKTGEPGTYYMSAKTQIVDAHIDISQPNSLVTERMLAYHKPMQAVSREIHPSADSEDPHWGLTVWDRDGERTFTASVLADMCNANMFKKLKAKALFANPEQNKVDLPKEILQRVQQEINDARTKVEKGFINMHEWYVEFRPFESNDFVARDVNSSAMLVAGQYAGDVEGSAHNLKQAANIRQDLELVLAIEMGMLN